MKKIFYFIVSALLLCLASCDGDKEDEYKTYSVIVQLVYPSTSDFTPIADVEVKLTDAKGSVSDAKTNNEGKATFSVTAGVYEASTTDVRLTSGESFIYSGIQSGITVTKEWLETNVTNITLIESKKGQIVIKELYVGGCPRDDGSGVFYNDKYVILYNNSDYPASLENLCLGMVMPYNAHASNNDITPDGKLSYESEGWIPAGNAIWYLQNKVTLEPGKQMVIALANAIDLTPTYSKSINFSNPAYYCLYDIEAFNSTTIYPSPSEVIPTSHYLLSAKYGTGNAWAISQLSPAFFVFTTKGTTPVAFANDESKVNYYGGNATAANARRKVPSDWVLDAVEVFTTTSDNNKKRLTAGVDAGQIYLANTFGYTSYRNVDVDATKAIEGNEAKLVMRYNKGTEINGNASTDPSGIDAEASIKNGARIIYKDTNNSTNDFHQRKQASLKD